VTWTDPVCERGRVLKRWRDAVLACVPRHLIPLAWEIHERYRKHGVAWANNAYYAKRLKMSPRTVQVQMSHLEALGAISRAVKLERVGDGTCRRTVRRVYLVDAIIALANLRTRGIGDDVGFAPPMYESGFAHTQQQTPRRGRSTKPSSGLTTTMHAAMRVGTGTRH
jgi:hypothetical protein